MRSLDLVRFDPEPPEQPDRWQVGYRAVLDDGRVVYPVTTVFASQIADTERSTVLAAADADIRPGLAIQNAPSAPAPEPPADWFDALAPKENA